jgi:hypothetical protein
LAVITQTDRKTAEILLVTDSCKGTAIEKRGDQYQAIAQISPKYRGSDTRELQCAALNLVALRTKDGAASLSGLVRSALRFRPDRGGAWRGSAGLALVRVDLSVLAGKNYQHVELS